MCDSHDARDGKEKLGLFCYSLFVMKDTIIWMWTSVSCERILQSLEKPLKNVKNEA